MSSFKGALKCIASGLALTLYSVALPGCGSISEASKVPGVNARQDVVDTAVAAGSFNTLVTALGQMVSISAARGVKISSANVVKPDVLASNGVIHVIDAVILPN